jgi:hypothetical protein
MYSGVLECQGIELRSEERPISLRIDVASRACHGMSNLHSSVEGTLWGCRAGDVQGLHAA